MDLIFFNGAKLYQRENCEKMAMEKYINKYASNSPLYKELFIKQVLNSNKPEYNIFGDDFKMEVIPKNIQNDCVLIIRDYDENQKQEAEITLSFNKDELGQLICLLENIKNKM